ncbi:unnamed protein product [Trichobilharzia szidati]|nr:unnamed protein product [Trichobilharzia szidati]
MMKLLPSTIDTKDLLINGDNGDNNGDNNNTNNEDYAFSSNLFIRPNGYKHFLPVRYPKRTTSKWFDNILRQLEKNKFLQWTIITLSDYDTCIGLQLIQWNNDILRLTCQIAPVLQQINLSNLNLTTLPFDLLSQFSTRLFSLNLSFNQIEMSIFKDFKSVYLWKKRQKRDDNKVRQDDCWIQTLNELHLDHNALEDVITEEAVHYMTNLKRLFIQNNAITSLRGLHSLTQLRVIRADFNKITNINDSVLSLKKIEYAYLSHNRITQPISGIRLKYLNHLRVIDLSHNGLSFLPAVIFNLPCLQTLKVDHNNLYSLPTIRSNSRISKELIESIDLSYNQINAISDGLLRITKHLDLSRNKLRIFPASLLKMIANMTKIRSKKPSEIIQLDLTDNPMIWPPSNIVEVGINAMIEYYLESRTEIQSYYGIKTMFLGAKNSGKSSLAMSILDRQTHMTESREEITYSIDSYMIHYDAVELTPKVCKSQVDSETTLKSQTMNTRPTTITLWDCSGHMAYTPLISFFTSLSTVVTILVDITKFEYNSSGTENINIKSSDSYFYKSIGIWLDIVMYRLNFLKVILLATKCDLISSEKELDQRMKNLYSQTSNYLKTRHFWLKDQITRIESSIQISQATSQYYEHLNNIYENAYISIYPNVIPINLTKLSNPPLINFDQLCYTLFDFVIKTPTHLPVCLAALPHIWSDIEMYLDDIKHNYNSNLNKLSNEVNACILSKAYFSQLLQNKFNLNTINLKQLLIYLNNTGRILIPDAFLSKEEEKYLNTTMKSFTRPYPKAYVIIDCDLFLESVKYLIHPNLLSVIDTTQHTNNSNKTQYKDPCVPETFQKELLRHFYSATRQGAINRLAQSCSELNKGSGIVSAYLWIALVEYNHLYVTKNNLDIGKSYVEILWRWLELAYPVPEPELFANFDSDLTRTDISPDGMKSPTWKFKYFPSPRELASACGIISHNDQSSELHENQSDTDQSDDMDTRQSPTNNQIQEMICSERLPALCFPCLIPHNCTNPMDEMSINLWETVCRIGPRPVIFVYRFSYGIPQELFDKATVRLNCPEYFKFRYTAHWKTGVQMFSSSNRIVVRFLLVNQPNEDCLIKFEFRGLPRTNIESNLIDNKSQQNDTTPNAEQTEKEVNSIPDRSGISEVISSTDHKDRKHYKRKQKCHWHNWPISESDLWELMLPLLKEFDGVLLAYKGLCYKRVMECPKCNELTFAGEWLTPQEAQTVNYRKCPACAHRIPSCLVAPPESGLEYKRKSKSKRKNKKHQKSRK